MLIKELFGVLFPHLVGVCVDQVFRSGTTVRIRARTGTVEAACPARGTPSQRVHSHYERRLSDTAVGGQEVLIHLRVHRFFCRTSTCAKATFAEQIPGLTVRYGRRSVWAAGALQAIALALGGRAGARLAGRLASSVSRMTLIRLIRALPDPGLEAGPRVLGVDDFALRRGLKGVKTGPEALTCLFMTASVGQPARWYSLISLPRTCRRSIRPSGSGITTESLSVGARRERERCGRWRL
ncbi:hypothetical protein BKM31_55345 [[Actinomadura] parvosata subsp. kistnae]|uniref:Transposase IS204/IS1001/IS1096/IS1165 zinc-finger domain-containing protein n=1 Tax=[Actinomadura] parvosata subsp. kistnae TaxID=1909395 RepID=A0A1V0AH75_9ACTN|nr:transposase family protein [Nonomuraea sp. ATCC 55076]AQZ69442.1 hypothetical protein BKM31_55345 [Nonomuraea sp. ATCC 55076]